MKQYFTLGVIAAFLKNFIKKFTLPSCKPLSLYNKYRSQIQNLFKAKDISHQ